MFPDAINFVTAGLAGVYAEFLTEIFTVQFYVALIGIIGVDILLSGDNALVIAAVTNKLPSTQRKIGVIAGSALAVFLRVALALVASKIISMPFLALAGGLYLIYVAYELVAPEKAGGSHGAANSIGGAILKIALLDVSMSFDNVLSITSMAHGSTSLLILGVAISIPMVILFSLAISAALQRFPWLKWAGAVLLAIISGKVIAHDPMVTGFYMMDQETLTWLFSPVAVGLVLLCAVIARIFEQERRTALNMQESRNWGLTA